MTVQRVRVPGIDLVSPALGATLVTQISGGRAWFAFTQAHLIFFIAIRLLGDWVSVVTFCGWQVLCMDLSASDVYRLTADKLQVCLARGLDSSGPVSTLRQID
jgi:hypothetical protein